VGYHQPVNAEKWGTRLPITYLLNGRDHTAGQIAAAEVRRPVGLVLFAGTKRTEVDPQYLSWILIWQKYAFRNKLEVFNAHQLWLMKQNIKPSPDY